MCALEYPAVPTCSVTETSNLRENLNGEGVCPLYVESTKVADAPVRAASRRRTHAGRRPDLQSTSTSRSTIPAGPIGRRLNPNLENHRSSDLETGAAQPKSPCLTGTARRRHRHHGQPLQPQGSGGSREDRGRRRELLYLPPYSPDLNPIEMAFSKFEALLRKAVERAADSLWKAIATILETFKPRECRNYFVAAGYDPT